MSPFNQAWALLKQQNYRQTALPGMAYDPEFDKRYYFTQEEKTPQISHIDYHPSFNMFRLRGENNEPLSTMFFDSSQSNKTIPSNIFSLDGSTPALHQRQGYYGKLMQGLLNAGINVLSNNRNDESQPFHEKFQENLTPNLQIEIGSNPYRKNVTPYYYSRKPIATFADSDLAQRDYGALPIKIFDDKIDDNIRDIDNTNQTYLDMYDEGFKQWLIDEERRQKEAERKKEKNWLY